MSDHIILNEKQKALILSILPALFVVVAIFMDTPSNILSGFHNIFITPGILLTDYIKVGGIGATFMNVGLLTLVFIFILYKLEVKFSGLTIASLFMLAGFSFFGKNITNVWPIFLGGYLYARYQGLPFKDIAVLTVFATSLAPMVSELAFGSLLSVPVGYSLGMILGISIGFIMPVLVPHVLKFYDGYNLYNAGFAAGILGTVLVSMMKGFGFEFESNMILSTEYDLFFKIFFISFFILLFVIGFIINGKTMKGYKELTKHTGKSVTDFTQLNGYGLTFMNMSLVGFIALIYITISGGVMNGPIVGAMLSFIGFSAFGNHPRNSIPIIIGVIIASLLNIWDMNATPVIIAGLFGTTLAPIAGRYGPIWGLVAGFLHLSVVMNIGGLHGGMNLYNNGFSGGIVAGTLVPIIRSFYKDE